MSDDPRIERTPADEDPAADQPRGSQEELNRSSRATGGDAPAAGSIEEREAVATDDDELFADGDDGSRDGGGAGAG